MKHDQIIELAEAAVLLFRRLVDEGLDHKDALSGMNQFITAWVLSEKTKAGEVKRPWEEL